jgi:Tfp pilus assembly protein FimV
LLSLSAVAAAAAIVPVHAAELGDVRVSSHLGQPLVADIELALVDDPAAAVGVRLASPEIYNGAGIAMPPALASLNLSVMRRDGRQFLHVTSLRAVDSDHLHLYLELADKGQRTVRLATLWLTPDPNPVPVPVPVPAPVPAPVQVPAPAFVAHAEPKPAPAVVPVPAPAPARASVQVAAKPPVREAHPHAAPVAPRATLQPLPIHGLQTAAPAACAHQDEQARACAALDGKNAALKERIGALEGKVKLLQGALRASPPPV